MIEKSDESINFKSIVFSDDLDELLLFQGDAIIGIEYQNKGGWRYINSPILNFSFNSKWSQFPHKWDFKGIEFEYLGLVEYHPYQFTNELHAVKVSELQQTVLFSFDRGIVGFINDGEKRQEFSVYNGTGILSRTNIDDD